MGIGTILTLVGLLLMLSTASGVQYECLNICRCDTDTATVDCRGRGLTELKLPEGAKLGGFQLLDLSKNDIVKLPTETELLLVFAQLQDVVMNGNKNFDCASLKTFKLVTIDHECNRRYESAEEKPMYQRAYEYISGLGINELMMLLADGWKGMTLKRLMTMIPDLMSYITKILKEYFQ